MLFCSRNDDGRSWLVASLLKRPVGRPIGGKPLDSTNNDNKPDNIRGFSIDYGTSSAYTLGTLKEKRPDMYERVQAGEMSPNAAMLKYLKLTFRFLPIPRNDDGRSWMIATLRESVGKSVGVNPAMMMAAPGWLQAVPFSLMEIFP